MNAVSEPICMAPESTRCAPNHSTATVEALKVNITIGKTRAISRPTATAVFVYWVLASAEALLLVVLPDEGAHHPDAGDLLAQNAVHPVHRLLHHLELGSIRRTTSATDRARSGTATATSQDSPTSSRNAMNTPPIIISGAETIIVVAMNTMVCTWVTSLVLREISVGAPNRETSCAENDADPTEHRRAHVPAEAGGGLGAQERRRHGRGHLQQRDHQHHGAGVQDVGGVALGHAVVDDLAEEAGQVQRRHGRHQLEHHQPPEQGAVRREVGAGEADEHQFPFVVRPCRATSTISAAVAEECCMNGCTLARQHPQEVHEALDRHPEGGVVRADELGHRGVDARGLRRRRSAWAACPAPDGGCRSGRPLLRSMIINE